MGDDAEWGAPEGWTDFAVDVLCALLVFVIVYHRPVLIAGAAASLCVAFAIVFRA